MQKGSHSTPQPGDAAASNSSSQASWDAFAASLEELAQRHCIVYLRDCDAVSLRHRDGCDSAFWGRSEPGPDAAKEFASFLALDEKRSRVLIAFRHFAHGKGLRLHRSSSGEWTAWRGYNMCQVDAGWQLSESLRDQGCAAALRTLAQQTRPLFESPTETMAARFDREAPNVGLESLAAVALTHDQVAHLLAQTAPPANEPYWQEDPPANQLAVEDDHPRARQLSAHWQQPAIPLPPRTGDADFDPFCALVLVKASRLGLAYHCTADAVSVRYRDGYDAALWERADAALRQQIVELGPAAAADRALDEFEKMDSKRKRVLLGFWHWATRNGLELERHSSGVWECGDDPPEWVFVNHRLTDLIARRGEAGALRRLIPAQYRKEDSGSLTQEQIRELLTQTAPPREPEESPVEHSIWADPEIQGIKAAHQEKMAPLELPKLAAYDLRELDSIADEAVKQYQRELLARADDINWLWNEPLWYRRGGDAWVDEAWWIETATRKAGGKANTRALETLLANGRDEFRPVALRRIQAWANRGCPRPEGWRGLCGCFYPDHPIARSVLEQGHTGEDRALLARLGHLPVRHYFREGIPECRRLGFHEEMLWRLTALGERLARRWIEPSELEACKAWCLEQADAPLLRLTQRHVWLMECAVAMRWPEIADALAANPAYLYALFGFSVAGAIGAEIVSQALIRRGIHSDAKAGKPPSRLTFYDTNFYKTDLLAWSLLRPGDYAGRLAAKALHLTRATRTHPDDALAAAIAWKRHRAGLKPELRSS